MTPFEVDKFIIYIIQSCKMVYYVKVQDIFMLAYDLRKGKGVKLRTQELINILKWFQTHKIML